MKKTISCKLDQVQKNQTKLENELDNNEYSVIVKRKTIINLSVEEILKKLQTGELNCIEVLKAYQAKVATTTIVF